MDGLLLAVLVYIVLQFGIGLWVSRRVRNESDYLLAGRQMGLILASFSIFATWFGAETVIGAAGAIYEHGVSGGSADPFGYALCIFLMGLIFAMPLWRRGFTTFADLFGERYSPAIERLATLMLIPGSVIWAAAQIRAFGQVLSSASSVDIDWAIGIAACLVIAYTAVGGLLADAWTDVVQGVVLIVGLVVLGGAVLIEVSMSRVDTALSGPRLAVLGHGNLVWYEIAEAWAVPVFGSVFAVELISRVLACRTAQTARNACLLGGGVYLLVGLIPASVGLLGPQLLPDLSEPEQLIPTLARLHLGTWFFTLFAGALISAILSTVDSALLSASALLSHNLIGHWRPSLTDRQRLNLARGGVVALGIIAYGIARESNTIFELVETASAFGSAGIFVVACFALGTPVGRSLAAGGAMLTGTVAWLMGEFVFHVPAPYLTALAASLVVYVLLAQVEWLSARLIQVRRDADRPAPTHRA
jgi:Na+/proline symporter